MRRHRILVAYDGSPESFRALEQAADSTQHARAQLGVVTAMPLGVDAPSEVLHYLRDCDLEAVIHAASGDSAARSRESPIKAPDNTVYLGTRDGAVARTLAESLSRADGPGQRRHRTDKPDGMKGDDR